MAPRSVQGSFRVALILGVSAAFWVGACVEETPTDANGKATLQVTPDSVAFQDTVGHSSPPAKSVAVSILGAGTVSGLRTAITYGSGATGWMTATLSDTIASDTLAPTTLILAANIATLTPATYQATVTLSGDAANTPITIPVTFAVAAEPPPAAGIRLFPNSISFSDTAGTSSPSPQSVGVTANGVGTLNGLAASVDYGTGISGWLTATLNQNTAPATLTLTASNTGLNASTYNATVRVSGIGAPNSPQAVAVTYSVAAPQLTNGVTVVFTANLACGGDLSKETAKVIEAANPDYIFMMGGNASATGTVTTLQDYMACYDPLFGRWKDKTFATLGDHETDIHAVPTNYFCYDNADTTCGPGIASGADAYFGAAHAGPAGKNWQSMDLGSWHVVALNVQSPGGYKRPPSIAYHAGSPQLDWLYNDLEHHNNACTLGVWYESMWMSSTTIQAPDDPLHKNSYRIQDVRGVWTALYDNNADLVINGWPHIYERFEPMFYANGYQHPTTSEWAADPVRGIRQFTSGLGGNGPVTAAEAAVRLPTSAYRSGGNGVLKIVLGTGEYTWEFLNTKYSHIQDSGRGTCH